MRREYEPLTVEQQQYLERQLAEAQEKLAMVDEWQEDWDGVGTADWTALSRILKGE